MHAVIIIIIITTVSICVYLRLPLSSLFFLPFLLTSPFKADDLPPRVTVLLSLSAAHVGMLALFKLNDRVQSRPALYKKCLEITSVVVQRDVNKKRIESHMHIFYN